MEQFAELFSSIETPAHRARMEEVYHWVLKAFPNLTIKTAWNQPMFTDHGTFIVAFSAAKSHLSVAPERAALDRFNDQVAQAGYERTKELIRIPWNAPVDYNLLYEVISFNIRDKADCATFWRK